jgi:hypothetical protein
LDNPEGVAQAHGTVRGMGGERNVFEDAARRSGRANPDTEARRGQLRGHREVRGAQVTDTLSATHLERTRKVAAAPAKANEQGAGV